MKFYNLYGNNKNIATITLQARIYGLTVSENDIQQITNLISKNARFCVFISAKGLEIFPIREKSALVGKIVGGRIACGSVLFFHDGACRIVTRKNWNDTWRMLTPAPEVIKEDRCIVSKRKPSMFDDAMPETPHKKMHKRGFSRTYMANASMINTRTFTIKTIKIHEL